MFRFTIRELVLLTLVVAMGVGWFVDRRVFVAAKKTAEWKLEMLATLIEETPGYGVSHDRARIRLTQGTTTKTQWVGGSIERVPQTVSPLP